MIIKGNTIYISLAAGESGRIVLPDGNKYNVITVRSI